jgi:tRNA/rRNA methyltransferase
VVLVSPRNPLNIGAAARAMSNFGCFHLRLVNPYNVAFREARSAVGAAALLANTKEYPTVADAVSDCHLVVGTTAIRHRELHHTLYDVAHGSRIIRKNLRTRKVALLFGSEKFGLSNEDMSHCDWLMHIPTHKSHVSMNLGQAVAVCLYELDRRRQVQPSIAKKVTGASAAETERITTGWFEALQLSGYVKPRLETSTEVKLRRMIRRFKLSSEDAKVWLGMVRQILWKLNERTKS